MSDDQQFNETDEEAMLAAAEAAPALLAENKRLRVSHDALLATAKAFANEHTFERLADLNLAIAKAEELAP